MKTPILVTMVILTCTIVTTSWTMTCQKSHPDGPRHVTVGEILSGSIPGGTECLISGRFLGWKGCGHGSHFMVTRSDWAIEDETGCIMVTGPMPKGLDPIEGVGKEVTIKVRVLKVKRPNGKNRVILRFIEDKGN